MFVCGLVGGERQDCTSLKYLSPVYTQEKTIAVDLSYPVLHDLSLNIYRDILNEDKAWEEVTEIDGACEWRTVQSEANTKPSAYSAEAYGGSYTEMV